MNAPATFPYDPERSCYETAFRNLGWSVTE